MLRWGIDGRVCFRPAAYAVGMVITFVALVLMDKGQPALLYLVPCMLVTAAAAAWMRKEMQRFWKGSSYQVRVPPAGASSVRADPGCFSASLAVHLLPPPSPPAPSWCQGPAV